MLGGEDPIKLEKGLLINTPLRDVVYVENIYKRVKITIRDMIWK